MRHFLFVGGIIFLILTAFTQEAIVQQLPPEFREYEKYLKESERGGYQTETPSYESQNIYEDTDTLRFEYEEVQKEEEEEEEEAEEKPTFIEYVVVDGDTVQTLLKASPKELQFFGKEFFVQTTDLNLEPTVSSSYQIGIGDNLILSLWGSIDYEYNLVVDREGKVFIPKAGTIALAGKSISQAESSLDRFLDKIYSDFELDVTVGKVRGATIFVVGEANKPGAFSIPGVSHVIDALVMAGGPNEFGSYRNIGVVRGGRTITTFDFYDFILSGKTHGNIQLSSGDVIVIPRLQKSVKVRGQVRRPAVYEIKAKTTLKDVIELAGGPISGAHIEAIMIDRVYNGKRTVKTFDLSDSTQYLAEALDGDDFSVFPIEQNRDELVFLQGQVVQQGPYGLKENMRVSDLIMEGEQLLPNAYTQRADLVRVMDNRRKEIISVNLDSAIVEPGGTFDPVLEAEDLLVVYSIWDIEDKDIVSIQGAVRRPGEFELFENMRISDLVFESGGALRSADLENCELARVEPGKPSQIIKLDLEKAIESPGSAADISMEPYDILFVREIPGWKLQEVISITGEVKYPGRYALEKSNERLSDLINRAGGFTNESFLKGAVFIRPILTNIAEDRNLSGIVQQTQEAVLDSAGNIVKAPFLFTYTPEMLARIIIDMDKVIVGKDEDDIIMEPGDSVYVPKRPTGVSVVGMVASSGTIHWLPNKKVQYYISRAGGVTRNADKKAIRIVKANGKVEKVSMRSGNIEPGDAIIVPQLIKKKTDWGEIINDTVSIISGLATTLYIILRL